MKKPQSLAGVIRENLDEIQRRLEIGIRQEVILAELAVAGHKTTLGNFRNELYRARKRREKRAGEKKIALIKNENKATKKTDSALTKSTGFLYEGTSIDVDDLI